MEYTIGKLTIGGVDFLKTDDIRVKAMDISLLDGVTVKTFYDGSINKYELEYDGVINIDEVQNKLRSIMDAMRQKDKKLLELSDENNEFIWFIETVTVLTKIFTSIYVLLTVKKTACTIGNANVSKQGEEIEKLKKLLTDTSGLLFSLDTIPTESEFIKQNP